MQTTQQRSNRRESPARDASNNRARDLNATSVDVPNRTRVVRLFVVPGKIRPADEAQVVAYARARHATRQDVFCVKDRTSGKWEPMSWLGKALVDHKTAAQQHPETVVVIMVEDRDQLQWECDVDFWVSGIVAVKGTPEFPNHGAAPATPFRDLKGEMGAPGKPILSGPAKWSNTEWDYDQLYKFTFTLSIPGEADDVIIDPDVFCDWS